MRELVKHVRSAAVILNRARSIAVPLAIALTATLAGCGSDLSLAPINRDPVALSLIATPTSMAPWDSATVVCRATDPDGDPVVFDWSAYNVLTIRGSLAGSVYHRGDSIVVHAIMGAPNPVDTGWVQCYVRDVRGGGADAGMVPIIIRQ